MKELIINWLNGKRNYTVGKLLYMQFGSDNNKKKLFETAKSALTESELLKTLQNLLVEDEIIVRKEDVQPYEPMPEEKKDDVLMALRSEWMPFYTEMNYLRHSLDPLLDDDSSAAEIKRATIAQKILTLEKKCRAVWAKRDYYLQHRKLPGISTTKEIVVDGFKAAKQIENIKTYIRQYRKKVKDNPSNSRAVFHLQRFQTELKQLEEVHGEA
jgi:hypothetical protein